MFNFFNKNNLAIDSLSIQELGWTLTEDTEEVRKWTNANASIIASINYFDKAPDIPTIRNSDTLRAYYRNQLANSAGGIIQSDLISIHQVPVIKNIFKISLDSNRLVYLGSLTIPFKRLSFVIKFQGVELGISGVRKSIVTSQLLNDKNYVLGENGIEGWSSDPYDDRIKSKYTMNLSEAEKYDAQFPDHILSQIRLLLKETENNIVFSEALKKERLFKK